MKTFDVIREKADHILEMEMLTHKKKIAATAKKLKAVQQKHKDAADHHNNLADKARKKHGSDDHDAVQAHRIKAKHHLHASMPNPGRFSDRPHPTTSSARAAKAGTVGGRLAKHYDNKDTKHSARIHKELQKAHADHDAAKKNSPVSKIKRAVGMEEKTASGKSQDSLSVGRSQLPHKGKTTRPTDRLGMDLLKKVRFKKIQQRAKELRREDKMKTLDEIREGYVSMAQQRAVWATRKDGGKGHPDNKRKRKKEDVDEGALNELTPAQKDMKTKAQGGITGRQNRGIPGQTRSMGMGRVDHQGRGLKKTHKPGDRTKKDKYGGNYGTAQARKNDAETDKISQMAYHKSLRKKDPKHYGPDSKLSDLRRKHSAKIGRDMDGNKVKESVNEAWVTVQRGPGFKIQKDTNTGQKRRVADVREQDSDAVKAFLAKGGKIKKLPPAKAQGYHGRDDPGKDMHGVMDRPDTKRMGTRKKVKSMEAVNVKDDLVIRSKKPTSTLRRSSASRPAGVRDGTNEARVINPKRMDAYRKFAKTNKVDHDSVRMAHDNPNHPETKRMMKNKNFSNALRMYKGASEAKETDPPFDDAKKISTTPSKDQFGNIIKNRAKHLARQAAKKAGGDMGDKK